MMRGRGRKGDGGKIRHCDGDPQLCPDPPPPPQLMEKLAALEAQLEHSVAEKARLEGEVEVCTQKLERAEKLITVCVCG